MSKPKILIYDLETSPIIGYTWGIWEQNVIKVTKDWEILSIAYKWYGEKTTHVISRNQFNDSTDKSLTFEIYKLLNVADIVIGHNCDSFDNKKARTRCIKYGFVPSPFTSIDTKKEAKKQFNFNGNSLDELCRFFGTGKKLKHYGFQLWEDCMNGKSEAWKIMRKYNKHDVILLEKVYEKLRPWIKHPIVTSELNSCPSCGSNKLHSRGTYWNKTQVYKRFQCQNCGKWCRSRTKDKVFKGNIVSI